MLELEAEINLLKSKNLINFIPNHLYNYFKIDFNERILKNLLNDLNVVIDKNELSIIDASLETLNSFKVYYTSIKDLINVFDQQKNLYNTIAIPSNEELFLYQRSMQPIMMRI